MCNIYSHGILDILDTIGIYLFIYLVFVYLSGAHIIFSTIEYLRC